MEHSGWDWVPVTSTRAWGYQLGARAQWVGASNDLIVFNERSCAANVSSDELCAQLYNITSRCGVLRRDIQTCYSNHAFVDDCHHP